MKVTDEQIDIVTQHYIIAAIWADCEEGTNPRCGVQERAKAREVCKAFIEQCEAAGGLFSLAMEVREYGFAAQQDGCSTAEACLAAFGQDFWLTRQGHGCGFWDRDALDLVELQDGSKVALGDLLTAEAKKFGECHGRYQYRGWWYFDETLESRVEAAKRKAQWKQHMGRIDRKDLRK